MSEGRVAATKAAVDLANGNWMLPANAMSEPQKEALIELLGGADSECGEHVKEVLQDYRQLSERVRQNVSTIEQAEALLRTLRLDIQREQGAVEQCLRNLLRWEPKLKATESDAGGDQGSDESETVETVDAAPAADAAAA